MAMPKTIGRYEILEEVGRGSMGAVYKARDPRIGRIVAIKTIAFSFPLGPGEEAEFLQRFYHEAQIAGRLNHPNIVTIYDVGEKGAEGDAYIAMEFVSGTNLHELLAGGGRLPLAQVSDVVDQLAQALDYAHDNGVVHRDIKPANILLTEAGQAKILDFGIARLETGGHTRPGKFFGTPNYMSPEQVTGIEVDGRADQFSLGVILYQLLTGEKPFVGESVTAITYQVVNVDPPPPSKLNPSLVSSFDRVLRKALSKGISDRYARCSDLGEDLKACVAQWRASSDRSTPRTLVSDREAVAEAGDAGDQAGVRGITFLAPRWVRSLGGEGSPLTLGWVVFLVCLGLLAAAPYLMFRGPSKTPGGPPFGALTIPWTEPDPTAPEAALRSDTGQEPRPAATARLGLQLQYRFDKARVEVRIDGQTVVSQTLRGSKGKSTWDRVEALASGRHRIEVRVRSDEGGFDEIDGVDLSFADGEKRELRITAGGLFGNKLKLRVEGSGQESSR